jgi:hypothetical protein
MESRAPIDAQRSPAAARMRRHRQRRRNGLLCLTIELRETEIDGLVRMGFLKSEMRRDLNAVREGLYAFYTAHWAEYRRLRQAARNA